MRYQCQIGRSNFCKMSTFSYCSLNPHPSDQYSIWKNDDPDRLYAGHRPSGKAAKKLHDVLRTRHRGQHNEIFHWSAQYRQTIYHWKLFLQRIWWDQLWISMPCDVSSFTRTTANPLLGLKMKHTLYIYIYNQTKKKTQNECKLMQMHCNLNK